MLLLLLYVVVVVVVVSCCLLLLIGHGYSDITRRNGGFNTGEDRQMETIEGVEVVNYLYDVKNRAID